jgi:hypothetical protein
MCQAGTPASVDGDPFPSRCRARWPPRTAGPGRGPACRFADLRSDEAEAAGTGRAARPGERSAASGETAERHRHDRGAQVSVPGPGLPVGAETLLALRVPDRSEPIILEVTVCSRQEDRHRLEFRVQDWRALAALSATAMGVGALTWATDAGEAVRVGDARLP